MAAGTNRRGVLPVLCGRGYLAYATRQRHQAHILSERAPLCLSVGMECHEVRRIPRGSDNFRPLSALTSYRVEQARVRNATDLLHSTVELVHAEEFLNRILVAHSHDPFAFLSKETKRLCFCDCK